MHLLGVVSGIATGFVLGLLGSGGSIIALPALVYLLDVAPKSALAMSLGVVGVTATMAAVSHARKGNLVVPVAVVFAIFGVIGSLIGTRIGVRLPVVWQLTLFAFVMYFAAWRMFRRSVPRVRQSSGCAADDEHDYESHGCPRLISRCSAEIALAGLGVGLLTGLVGAGGGFLIVPALVLFSGLSMKKAVGTSLAIVAVNAYAGFYGYLGAVPLDWKLMGEFISMTLLGSLAGAWASHRLSHDKLKRAFAWFLLIVATYILFKNLA